MTVATSTAIAPAPATAPVMRPGILYVDPRIGSREFLDTMHTRHGLRVALASPPLVAGDFAFRCGHMEPSPFCDGKFGCRLAVERKTVSDAVGSLLKQRLHKQVPDLLDNYTMSWIVVEGLWRCGNDDTIEIPRYGSWVSSGYGLTYSQLSSWMVRYDVMGRGSLHRWRTGNQTETAAFISSLYGWWQKEWRKHSPEAVDKMPAPIKALMFRASQLQRTAASLPEIGIVNCKRVAKHFRSIREMMNADIDEWQKLVGKKDGAAVYAAITKEYR